MSDFTILSGGGNATSAGGGLLTVSETGQTLTLSIGVSGTYDLTAYGAHGGASNIAFDGIHVGASGGTVSGDIFLAAGTQLEIVVGVAGGNGASAGGGGGGGSFVFENNGGTLTLLEAAGGGGGGSYAGDGYAGGSSIDIGAGGGGGTGGGGGGGFAGGGGGGSSGNGGSGFLTTHGFAGASTIGFDGGAGYSGATGHGGFGGGGGAGFSGGGGGGGYGGGHGGIGAGGFNDGGNGGGNYFISTGANVHLTAGGANALLSNANGEVTIAFVPAVCFASGTRIATRRGKIAVEDLAVGDLAVTATGAARPIVWLGHRRIDRPTAEQMPVRVMAGAFGEGLPARDLYLSPGHAVCVSVLDEVFVPAGQLINGVTIAQVEVAEVTYWHVELERHDVLLAEGLPCESYMDAGNRAWFGRAYGRLAEVDPKRVAESLTRYARPFVNRGPVVAAIRARLAERSSYLTGGREAA